MNDIAVANDPAPPCLPRGGKTAFGITTALVSGTLLLRYLHIEGIEIVFLDIMSTPSVGLPILVLFTGLLTFLVLMFVIPIWLIGHLLTEQNTSGTGGNFSTSCSLCSDETLCVLGLLGRKQQKQQLGGTQASTSPVSGNEPKRGHWLSVLVIGAAWAAQLYAAIDGRAWNDWATISLIVLPPLLAAALLARWQRRSIWWLLQFGAVLIFACVQVTLFAFLVHKTSDEANPILAGSLALLLYLWVLVVYLYANESNVKTGKNGKMPPAFRVTPAWAWRWLPLLASFIYLGSLTLFLSESFLLNRAAEIVGIKSHNRQILLQTLRDAEPTTESICGQSTGNTARTWQCFDTAYHFGAIEIFCAAPTTCGQTCYLARDGQISSAFTRTMPADTAKPDRKNP